MLFRLLFPFALTSAAFAEPVSFSREVLPLLSDNCLSCHGQDAGHRKADLRLDTPEGAREVLKSGDFIDRITTDDPDEIMPPPKSHKPKLKTEQIALLKRWISEGAAWGKHWSFEKPVKARAEGHPVDFFVKARLAKEGLKMSPKAPEHTLRRRLAFDLTGLPPDPTDQSDPTDLIDKLLASPHYGERMAMFWLDAARYSDTDGFQSDATRTNWPWRDYVIESFNANKPFDQFTLEQFAGDLLPNATPEQKLATCFHRNHMTNGEGGRDKEESRIDYVIDRVNTMGTVWLGLTLGCTQCHTHKFDPISHHDYYALNAFFNSIDEDGAAGTNAKPYMPYQSPNAKRAVEESQKLVETRQPIEAKAKADAEKPFTKWLEEQKKRIEPDHHAWQVVLGAVESQEGSKLTQTKDGIVTASGSNPKQDDYRLISTIKLPRLTGLKLEVLPQNGVLSRGKTGEFILTDIKVQVRRQGSSQIRDILVKSAVADTKVEGKAREYGDVKGTLDDDPRNGWTTKGFPKDQPHTALYGLAEPLVLESDEELIFELRHRSTNGDANIAKFRLSATDQPGPAVREIGPTPLEKLAKGQIDREKLLAQFLEDYEPYQIAKASLDRSNAQLKEVQAAAGKLNVMVLAERKEPRDTHVLLRGVWDKKGDVVPRGVPAAIAPWPEGLAKDRVGLAKWITSKENPLTARVFVNQVWQMLFGAGLVRTPDDFGLQGQRPTHPELLDWLAVDFMENGWDVKRLIKTIVTSETYQQSSELVVRASARSEGGLKPELQTDPSNLLLSRGPRFRLPAWMIRDAALASSGLLNPALGGPPVRPHQPEGVWEELFMGRYTYEPSQGAAQYRRTLYAFWRRSIAPTFLFDSAQRRVCEVSMSRTNTPLQALTLLNDQTIMEASQALAKRLLIAKAEERLKLLYQAVLSRKPTAKELSVLQRELDRALTHYRKHPEDARKLKTSPEMAAHALVATLVLNLDEAITHE
ncbi:MAG: PSD1 domain-containing protein [Verrucomicrobiaceae bacterium]|nr:PSD1 domain-containing protein [Verrucomicrobiaceae bacterium]